MVKKGEIMKKIIIFLCLSVFAVPAYAVDMCASDDTVAVVLDPGVAITSSSYDNAKFEWRVEASYGTIIGVASCVSEGSTTNYRIHTREGGKLTDSNNGVVSVGGEKTGYSCFCKIIHPVVSLWGKVCDMNDFRALCGGEWWGCSTRCPFACAEAVKNNPESFRARLFGSVTN